ncbi:aldo/keto reductase [Parvibaculum sp.]|uniref:aldo/keto reductase n=1 Tax=Parvibaculum sp. TaxID=2024848 RepID=UPI000C9456A1|nr:aldo/keto reductase [Parvibaculum sp.]MAB14140.1 hypothetical protein [Parvibaculum sp.]
MEMRQLGDLWPVSALTLGGGGLGLVWGNSTREEAVATVRAAVDAGINFLDLAPLYGQAESVVGEAFDGGWPSHLRVSTKCMVGARHADDIPGRLEKSVRLSLETLKREHADCYILHSNIHPDDYVYEQHPDYANNGGVSWSRFVGEVIPTFESLKARGIIGAWGVTGIGLPISIMEALRSEPKPDVVQVIANLMDSAGGLKRYEEPTEPRNIIRTAKNNDVGVMGIRAVQAGALTAAFDRPLEAGDPDMKDYEKAVPFRALCESWGEDPAAIAHRYALAIEGVDTVVLGVKNRAELGQLVDAAEKGPLDPAQIAEIEALGLRRQIPRIPLDAPI